MKVTDVTELVFKVVRCQGESVGFGSLLSELWCGSIQQSADVKQRGGKVAQRPIVWFLW